MRWREELVELIMEGEVRAEDEAGSGCSKGQAVEDAAPLILLR